MEKSGLHGPFGVIQHKATSNWAPGKVCNARQVAIMLKLSRSGSGHCVDGRPSGKHCPDFHTGGMVGET